MFTAIWKLGRTDFEDIKAIRLSVFSDELGMDADYEFDDIDDYAAHLLVRVEGDIPVATMRAYPQGRELRLGRLCVLPKYRKMGYGDLCLRMALDRARDMDIDGVRLEANAAATALYERFGFAPTGKESVVCGIKTVEMYLPKDKIDLHGSCGGH